MMKLTEARRSAIHRPPPEVQARPLREALLCAAAPAIFDVREESAFRSGHLPHSVNVPESRTTLLVKKVQEAPCVVLVCDDGRLSAMVARTLGVCGFPNVAYLKGGLQSWLTHGGSLMETSRLGNEVPVGLLQGSDPAEPRGERPNWETPKLILLGLAVVSLLGYLTVRLLGA
jgi:rhodanese-related sulfurtransferase